MGKPVAVVKKNMRSNDPGVRIEKYGLERRVIQLPTPALNVY
jgi:hypothetical protein